MLRRELLHGLAALGVGTPLFQRAVVAAVDDPPKAANAKSAARSKAVTPAMVEQAEWVAGVTLTDDERKRVAGWVTRNLAGREKAHAIPLPNGMPPAIHFDPTTGITVPPSDETNRVETPTPDVKRPADEDDLAFLGVAKLGHLLRTKQLTSVELTKLCLARLKAFDPVLKCVVTLLPELALKQAKQADAELAAGKVRGPLHGIPWGAKDLIAVPGAPTTWGAGHFQTQVFDTPATVATKLQDAGAVLVAKLTLGTLALGDVWFGGTTKNPWNPRQGSSGSSAGSACAVAAGLVPFAIGSETLGSIVSPSTRCGVTGLRPTFGRVSRAGCMSLAFTMDKLGPLTRSVEDAALVLAAIHGRDPADPPTVDRPFDWPSRVPVKLLKVGYFASKRAVADRPELVALKAAGCELVPVELPTRVPAEALHLILDVEAAAMFDDITYEGVKEGIGFWADTFRRGRFVSAVDYVRANRLRTLLMQDMAKLFETVDLYVGGNDLLITNLTGHPSVCLPTGFTKAGDFFSPRAVTLTGRLYGESRLLAAARVVQDAAGEHLKRPPLDKVLDYKPGADK
jgi:Asp-tRNA(Asn)/Glu-tRNA(Gln) amidotransferase A subunit family amidase